MVRSISPADVPWVGLVEAARLLGHTPLSDLLLAVLPFGPEPSGGAAACCVLLTSPRRLSSCVLLSFEAPSR